MKFLAAHGVEFCCDSRKGPGIAGILNLSPDSFSGDGKMDMESRFAMIQKSGASFVDVGAESTRPGSQPVPEEMEIKMIRDALRFIRSRSDLPVSVDTRKSAVAEMALNEGADIINDVSGLQYDPAMADVIAAHGAGLILMHSRGTPETMQSTEHLQYNNVCEDVSRFFHEQLAYAESRGIRSDHIMLDPGIGFAKTQEQNLELIRYGAAFRKEFQLPVLYGVSRKRLLGELTGQTDPAKRDFATAGVLAYLAVHGGVDFFRVHDPVGMNEMLKLYYILLSENKQEGVKI
jgi:dihydropteroate synthase